MREACEGIVQVSGETAEGKSQHSCINLSRHSMPGTGFVPPGKSLARTASRTITKKLGLVRVMDPSAEGGGPFWDTRSVDPLACHGSYSDKPYYVATGY